MVLEATELENKLVYVPMVADYIHHGHINIINIASKYGRVVVGLMTDEAAASYKRLPLLPFAERKQIVESIVGVDEVVPQNQLDYVPAIQQHRPDVFVHGSDWKTGVQKKARERVLEAMEKIGGCVVEPEYTKGVSSSQIIQSVQAAGISPERRLSRFKALLNAKEYLRGIEAHNGLTGLLAESTVVEVDEGLRSFDFLWLSSLTDSTAKGKPDIELVDSTSRQQTIQEILDVTTIPIVYDADTGGKLEHFPYLVSSLSRLGVSACVIEDKKGLKRNSLFGTDVEQIQEDPEIFAEKIITGKRAACSDDFLVIARIESLILGAGVEDAIRRAKIYLQAGADGIMIHSREKSLDEIKAFCNQYQELPNRAPLVLVPSSFNSYYENELSDIGADIIIYANHLLRSAYPAMKACAETILRNGRSLECDSQILSIKEILALIPGT